MSGMVLALRSKKNGGIVMEVRTTTKVITPK